MEARERAQKPADGQRDLGADYEGEEGIWESIDYAGPDSEGESDFVASSPVLEGREVETDATSEDEDGDTLEDLYVRGDDEDGGLLALEEGRAILDLVKQGTAQEVSEATVLREAIHMLHGLPTSLFEIGPASRVTSTKAATIMGTSVESSQSVLARFAQLGSITVPMKAWTQTNEQSSTMCRFQSIVETALGEFLGELQEAERSTIDPDLESPTCIHLLSRLTERIRPVELLISCLPAASGHNREVRLLDSLVQLIIQQDTIGAPTTGLVAAFTSCFETYWRPVEAWLQGGNVACDGITFLHAAREKDLPLDGLWRGLFDFTFNEDAAYEAPAFLQPFIADFMTIGKTAYMLNKLDQQAVIHKVSILPNWMDSVLLHGRHMFEPFESCLQRAMQKRLAMSQGLSKGLLNHLHADWGFRQRVTATELVYLAKIGSVNDRAYTALFHLWDRSRYQEWGDQHVLTGIFQDAFADADGIDSSRLTASFVPTDRSTDSRNRSLVQLEAIRLNLALSWPLANIIDAGAVSVLQRVAILLIQTARAKDVLDQYSTRFNPDRISNAETRRAVMSLQQRLRWFVDTLHSYLAFDVLSSTSLNLSVSSSEASDLDAVILEFKSAIESLERGCLLSEDMSSSHQALISILDLAVVLSDLCLRNRPATADASADAMSDGGDSADESLSKSVSQLPTSSIEPDGAKLRGLSATFHSLLTFVQAGLREASRLNSDDRLELFADDIALELASLKWAR